MEMCDEEDQKIKGDPATGSHYATVNPCNVSRAYAVKSGAPSLKYVYYSVICGLFFSLLIYDV